MDLNHEAGCQDVQSPSVVLNFIAYRTVTDKRCFQSMIFFEDVQMDKNNNCISLLLSFML